MLYVYQYSDLLHRLPTSQYEINGKWVPARPMPWQGWQNIIYRLRAAWEVFRGRADAFTWPEGQ